MSTLEKSVPKHYLSCIIHHLKNWKEYYVTETRLCSMLLRTLQMLESHCPFSMFGPQIHQHHLPSSSYQSWPHPLKGENKQSFTKLVGWIVYPRVHRRGTVGRPWCWWVVDQIELKSQRRTGPQWWSVGSGINRLVDEVAVGVEALGFQRDKRTIWWRLRLWRRKGRETRIRRRRGRKKRGRRGGQESGPLCFKREGKKGTLSCNFRQKKHSRNLGPSFGFFPIFLYPHLNPPLWYSCCCC